MVFPPIPLDILDALQKRFPERSPNEAETYGELMVRAGEARVLRFLRQEYLHQQDNVLDQTIVQDVLRTPQYP